MPENDVTEIAVFNDFKIKKGIDDLTAEFIHAIHEDSLNERTFLNKERGIAFFQEMYSLRKIGYWVDDIVYTIWKDNVCVGFVRALPKKGWITHVFVLPELQGKGLGKVLMQYAEQELKERGFNQIFLNAEPKRVNFYLAQGWNTTDVKEMVHENLILIPMEKALTS